MQKWIQVTFRWSLDNFGFNYVRAIEAAEKPARVESFGYQIMESPEVVEEDPPRRVIVLRKADVRRRLQLERPNETVTEEDVCIEFEKVVNAMPEMYKGIDMRDDAPNAVVVKNISMFAVSFPYEEKLFSDLNDRIISEGVKYDYKADELIFTGAGFARCHREAREANKTAYNLYYKERFVTYKETQFNANQGSIDSITSIMSLNPDGPYEYRNWKNEFSTLTKQEMLELQTLIREYLNDIYKAKWEVDATIDTTVNSDEELTDFKSNRMSKPYWAVLQHYNPDVDLPKTIRGE